MKYIRIIITSLIFLLILISSYGLYKNFYINTKYKSVVFHDNIHFDFQFLRTLSLSVCQMADINECFATARQIESGNFESWYDQWYATAQRIHTTATQALENGHTISAQSAFLRASNYYRTSEFYLHSNPHDPRIREASQKSHICFTQAIALMKPYIIPVKIPYESTTLPGYFYMVDNKKRPTIIMQTGLDGTQEELYCYAQEAIKRGYHVLTFEGPGQGYVLREQGIPFRPDWEVVIRSVVDFIITRTEVDSSQLILYGLSLGGYLTPRGASGDNRIKILITNGGFYDLVAAQATFEGTTKNAFIEDIKKNEITFDQTIQKKMKSNLAIKFFFEHGMFSFDAKTPSELMLKCAAYTLENHAHLIKSITLIVDAEKEKPVFQGQAQHIYNHLTCPKTYMLFTDSEAAGFHCQIGALLFSTQRIFDWLDQTLAATSSKISLN